MDFVFAYITTPGLEDARRIGKILVMEHLAACVNILPEMESLYEWNGVLETSRETVLIAKTRTERREELLARVLDLHTAEIPCVVFLPLSGGHPDYLEWIANQSTA